MTVLSADELLAGSKATHRVELPAELLPTDRDAVEPAEVVLRPLVLADILQLHRAAGSDALSGALQVQQALVEPALSLEQVHLLPAGIVEFLLGQVNRISGLTMSGDDLETMVHDPLARACVALSREFGWTPETCAELTVGQVLVYLEMIARGEQA